MIETTFRSAGSLDDELHDLYVRVLLRDANGVVVASLGDPNPVAVTIEGPPVDKWSFDIPWWVWAIAGGAVVAGGTTAAIVLLPDRETRYALGPADVTF